MPKLGTRHKKNSHRGLRSVSDDPRDVAVLGLEALFRYRSAGLAKTRDRMHENLASRLARAAVSGKWG